MKRIFESSELVQAKKELVFHKKEKEDREDELMIANKELAFQNEEKDNRAAELVIANKELAFQNKEKEKRAAELLIANKELAFQNEEKDNRAAELIVANKELAFQNKEKENRAAELVIANKELAFQNKEKEKRAAELIIANKELAFQKNENLKEISDYKYALDEASILAITNQKGIITYANQNFCRISKYTVDELIGQDHRIINSGYHSKEFIRNMWVSIGNGNVWRDDIKNKAKDGSIYWVDTTIVPFLNALGKPYQYVAIRSDITEKKLAEEEIRILHEGLEQRVKDRTEELESFSYSVSHDLRAPLRAINGYAEMLKEGHETQFDEETTRIVNNIMNNATRMGQLIDDLLAFSRLGRKELVMLNIPMNEMVTNLCREINLEQGKKAIRFEINELQSASGDFVAIKQVWVNLISNAVKFSSLTKDPIVEIGSAKKEGEVVYFIKDNGAGFDMRYSNKLFGVFQRLHSNTKFEGTGVGLAIVHRIITKHGGKVWAEGKVNEGATFYFSLPQNQQ